MKKRQEHLFGAIENWLRSTSAEDLLQLKEKCAYWRQQTGNKEYYPYYCVVWQFNKGPEGQEWGEETIRKELNIPKRKVHESEWIGLHMLGWEAKRSSAYASRKRIADDINNHWRQKKELEKEAQRKKNEAKMRTVEALREKERIMSLEHEIVQDARSRRPLIDKRIEKIRLLKESLELEKELEKWDDYEKVWQRIREIEQEEERLMQRLKNKGRPKH